MKHIKSQQELNETQKKLDLSGVIKRYIYSDSGPNGSGYVKDMTINADTGGLVILNGNGQKAKDWLKKAVDLMNKYNDL